MEQEYTYFFAKNYISRCWFLRRDRICSSFFQFLHGFVEFFISNNSLLVFQLYFIFESTKTLIQKVIYLANNSFLSSNSSSIVIMSYFLFLLAEIVRRGVFLDGAGDVLLKLVDFCYFMAFSKVIYQKEINCIIFSTFKIGAPTQIR